MCSGVSYRRSGKRGNGANGSRSVRALVVDFGFDARADAFGVQVFAHIARAAQQGVVDLHEFRLEAVAFALEIIELFRRVEAQAGAKGQSLVGAGVARTQAGDFLRRIVGNGIALAGEDKQVVALGFNLAEQRLVGFHRPFHEIVAPEEGASAAIDAQLRIHHALEGQPVVHRFLHHPRRFVGTGESRHADVLSRRQQVIGRPKHEVAVGIFAHVEPVRRAFKSVVGQAVHISVGGETQLREAVAIHGVLAHDGAGCRFFVEVGARFHRVVGGKTHRETMATVAVTAAQSRLVDGLIGIAVEERVGFRKIDHAPTVGCSNEFAAQVLNGVLAVLRRRLVEGRLFAAAGGECRRADREHKGEHREAEIAQPVSVQGARGKERGLSHVTGVVVRMNEGGAPFSLVGGADRGSTLGARIAPPVLVWP